MDRESDPKIRAGLASRTKARAVTAAEKTTRDAIQMHGAVGYTNRVRDWPLPEPGAGAVGLAGRRRLSQVYKVRPTTIYGGSNEIQRNSLSKAVLGLPG